MVESEKILKCQQAITRWMQRRNLWHDILFETDDDAVFVMVTLHPDHQFLNLNASVADYGRYADFKDFKRMVNRRGFYWTQCNEHIWHFHEREDV